MHERQQRRASARAAVKLDQQNEVRQMAIEAAGLIDDQEKLDRMLAKLPTPEMRAKDVEQRRI